MSMLEIKGGLLEMIANLDNKELLLQVQELLADLIQQEKENTDWWDELPTEAQQKIDAALIQIEDEANLISHEEVLKKYRKWQKK